MGLDSATQQLVQEAINDRLIDLERASWTLISGLYSDDNGPTLDNLRGVIPKLREMAASNPWHVRGAALIHAYVFGRGMNYLNIEKPESRKIPSIIASPRNSKAIFSPLAQQALNLASFTTGNVFILRLDNGKTPQFILVPLEQIVGHATNPDDATDVWFLKRKWTTNGEVHEKWYPMAHHVRSGERLPKEMAQDHIPVDKNGRFYHKPSYRQDGWTWGIPESLAAMVWTEAYSAYLRDNATLVKALSKIAWKITSQTTGGAAASAVTVRDAGEGIGGVASLAGGMLQGVGVPSAQVNMGNGQPLIAATAASFGVPVIALLSSPGETGGSYGSAATLDEPTLKGMMARQATYQTLYQEILWDLGAKDATVEFPAIQTDPAYRRIAGINTTAAMGAIWRDEQRAAIMQIEDIPNLHGDTLPVADGFNSWKDPNAQSSSGQVNDPLARQGNTGVVPGGTDQNSTNHDSDNE